MRDAANSNTVRFSLLHATYHRDGGPLPVRDAWLAAAENSDTVEYVCGMDSDDHLAVTQTADCARSIGAAWTGRVTAVRNWNAAAALAAGDFLLVISDDLEPCPGWDRRLNELTTGLDPRRHPYVVKVSDAPVAEDTKCRHPVVSREFYSAFGLFSPRYRGLYADDDLSNRAFWRAMLLDGTSIEFRHRHPFFDDEIVPTDSHRRVNSDEEARYGRHVYLQTWPPRHRVGGRQLVAIGEGNGTSWPAVSRTAKLHRVRSLFRYSTIRRRGLVRRLSALRIPKRGQAT